MIHVTGECGVLGNTQSDFYNRGFKLLTPRGGEQRKKNTRKTS